MHQAKQILIIEDDEDITELLKYNLEKEGYTVHTETNGEKGLQLSETLNPSIVVLDIMLPGMDGLDICRHIRQTPSIQALPILMLSAKGEESDVIVGLELGADGYMTKPFSPREFLARIRALFRREALYKETQKTKGRIEIGPIVLDFERHEVLYLGHNIPLTLAEFNLVRTLLDHPGRVYTRNQLVKSIAGEDASVINRNIDVHIRAIRKKFGDGSKLILTVRGVGYKWRE